MIKIYSELPPAGEISNPGGSTISNTPNLPPPVIGGVTCYQKISGMRASGKRAERAYLAMLRMIVSDQCCNQSEYHVRSLMCP